MKRLYFPVNFLCVKSLYRVSIKFKKNTFFITQLTLKVMYKSLWKSNFKVKKLMIGHICYWKYNSVPSSHHTQNFLEKLCQIVIVFTSIATSKWLVRNALIHFYNYLFWFDIFLLKKYIVCIVKDLGNTIQYLFINVWIQDYIKNISSSFDFWYIINVHKIF